MPASASSAAVTAQGSAWPCGAVERVVAGHQIDHLPWLGYFSRMSRVGAFVDLDHVQYNHHRFQNRNRIVDARGRVHWLHVPVRGGKRRTQRMIDVEIADEPWHHRYLETVRHVYARHPYFDALYPRLALVVDRPWTRLLELNRALRALLAEQLGIETRMPRQGDLGLGGAHGERLLIELSRAVGGTHFLSGPTGRKFLDRAAFAQAGLRLSFDAPFRGAPYPQRGLRGFAPDLSALDLLMNLGPAAGSWLRDAHGLP